MTRSILIGIAAGLASALLFVAPIGGTVLGTPLFALTGLPIVIAALGWGTGSAISAGVVGGTVLAALSWAGAAMFVLLFAAPLVWLSGLALLWREVDPGQNSGREWYPIGQLLARAAAAAATSIVIVGVIIGFDPPTLITESTTVLLEFFADSGNASAPTTAADIEPFVRVIVGLAPIMAGVSGLLVLVLDLWLGGMVARMSGRVERPRDTLWTVELPRGVFVGFAVAALVALVPGPLGYASQAFAGALGAAIALMGLAVIHALTIGMTGRIALLALTYIIILVSGFAPIVLLLLLGFGEGFLKLRTRGRQDGGP